MTVRIFFNSGAGDDTEFISYSDFLSEVEGWSQICMRVEDDGETLSTTQFQHTPDDYEIVESLLWDDGFGSSPAETYTKGDCDVFAAALYALAPVNARIIACYDPVNPETGRRTRGAPYLIHAGLVIDDFVYDIDGKTHSNSWACNWAENGHASENWGWGQVDVRELERMQKSKITKKQLEEARPYAELISLVFGIATPELKLSLDAADEARPAAFAS